MIQREKVEYREIEGFPKYLAGEDGTIWSSISQQILKPHETNSGYMKVTLNDDKGTRWTINVHRVIAECFCTKKEKEANEVNHINGDKTDNRAENLEWVTRSENLRHAFETGLKSQDTSARAVVATNMETGEQMEFESIYKAARFLNVSQGNICMCCKKKRPFAGGYYWDYAEGGDQ